MRHLKLLQLILSPLLPMKFLQFSNLFFFSFLQRKKQEGKNWLGGEKNIYLYSNYKHLTDYDFSLFEGSSYINSAATSFSQPPYRLSSISSLSLSPSLSLSAYTFSNTAPPTNPFWAPILSGLCWQLA